MARIRSLKPSFFKSEDLAALSSWHRLCYQGLWCWADREGRLEDRPRRLKAEIFPYDDLDMEALLGGLAKAGFIVRYEVSGKRYIEIPTFTIHQTPRKDEWDSEIPPSDGAVAVPQRYDDGPVVVESVGSRDIGSREVGSRKVGGGEWEVGDTPPPADERREHPETRTPGKRAEDLQELWNAVTSPPIARCRDLTDKRRKHIKRRLQERPFEEWADVFRRVQASSFCRGEVQSTRGDPWVASFDWIICSPDNAVKVLEGKYDDRDVQQKTDRERAIDHNADLLADLTGRVPLRRVR